MQTAVSLKGFQPGDTTGEKRDIAVKDAKEQAQKCEKGSMRQKLYLLQEALGVGDLPDVDCPLQHTFAPGVYARTIFIPAGTCIVGKIHKHQHLNILSVGEVTVVTEQGGDEELKGPMVMVSPPGTKRAVYAHTDVVWTTIHLTENTDLEQIEDEVICPTYEDYELFVQESKRLGGDK